jgi:hypothetical protein
MQAPLVCWNHLIVTQLLPNIQNMLHQDLMLDEASGAVPGSGIKYPPIDPHVRE